jgi:dihydroorotate dehydrogenase
MNSNLKRIIISPPFGTYLNFDWATSVKGTWTAFPRPGNRVLRAIRTIRHVEGGWINNIGLINDGISSGVYTNPNLIYSISAVDNILEWSIILKSIPNNRILEMNIGCPNENKVLPTPKIYKDFKAKSKLIIIKLPPDKQTALDIVETALESGITHFHCCNTLPTPKGGRSGTVLKYHSLALIDVIKHKHPHAIIIGGGGIYTPNDIQEYHDVGVEHFSLATIWFTPWLVPIVKREIQKL